MYKRMGIDAIYFPNQSRCGRAVFPSRRQPGWSLMRAGLLDASKPLLVTINSIQTSIFQILQNSASIQSRWQTSLLQTYPQPIHKLIIVFLIQTL